MGTSEKFRLALNIFVCDKNKNLFKCVTASQETVSRIMVLEHSGRILKYAYTIAGRIKGYGK